MFVVFDLDDLMTDDALVAKLNEAWDAGHRIEIRTSRPLVESEAWLVEHKIDPSLLVAPMLEAA